MAAYLEGQLWLTNARAANAASQRLAAGLHEIGAELIWPAQANMIFARLDPAAHDRAQAEASYYVMDQAERPLCRLVCDFTKSEEEVDRLLTLFAG
jgi:threonine aldolase